MEHILYRGKSLETKEWIEGTGVFQDPDTDSIFILVSQRRFDPIEHIEIIKETLSRYTNINDRYHKPIFEGATVNCWDWGNEPNDLICRSVVEWSDDDMGWTLNPDPTDGDRYDLFRNIEITGHIYDGLS